MIIITQGLAALATFLIVVNSLTVRLGQQLVVIVLFFTSALWCYMLGRVTVGPRVYSILVLADSVRFLNAVLGLDEDSFGKTKHSKLPNIDGNSSALKCFAGCIEKVSDCASGSG